MTAADATRLAAMLGAVEIALVRRDRVAGPLLAQAARAAEGLPPAGLLTEAARITRSVDVAAPGDDPAAARKVTQALCRAAAQMVQHALVT